jgi:hypothetical protein
MRSGLFKFGILILLASGSVFTVQAQTKACNLHLKIYVYDAKAPRNRLENADLVVKNLKTKEKKALALSPTAQGFENLAEGKYRIDVTRQGYKQKSKAINLECEFADQQNVVWQSIYLWKDKTASEADLTEEVVPTKPGYYAQSNVQQKDGGQQDFGKVSVQVVIDEDGNVISAKALDGKPSLVKASIKAVRQSVFAPTMLAGIPVKVTGVIVYNFVP